MSTPLTAPPIVRLSDLKPGERGTFFALLVERKRSDTRENKAYYQCKFRDKRRTVAYMVWSDGPHFAVCDREWQAGQFFKIQAKYEEHERFGPQIDYVWKIRVVEPRDEADGFNKIDFIDGARREPELTLKELRELVETSIADEPLRKLTLGLLEKHGDVLKRLPAHEKRFYVYEGGWLEHVLHVTQNCVWLADRYRERFSDLKPPINRDVLIAGAVLHDIGRAVELKPGATIIDAAEATIPGRLLGHLFLGRDLVRDASREQGDVNPERLQLLEHLIVAHLNHPEWGSPRLPLIPEAIILHHVDDMDAKLEMFVRCITHDPSDGPFTDYEPLLKRQLLKQREV